MKIGKNDHTFIGINEITFTIYYKTVRYFESRGRHCEVCVIRPLIL